MHLYCLAVFLLCDSDLRFQLAQLRLFWPAAFALCIGLATYLFNTAGARPGYVSRALDFRDIPQMPQLFEDAVGDKPVVSDRYEVQLQEETSGLSAAGSKRAEELRTEEELDYFSADRQTRAFEFVEDEEPVPRREVPSRHYCEHCRILQPYRTKHCHVCQACVGKFDHHCFWIGGCVGELNHRKFFFMLLAMTCEFAIGTAYVAGSHAGLERLDLQLT